MDQPQLTKLNALREIISRERFFCHKEEDFQGDIALLFDRISLPYEKEKRLSSRDRVDFFLPRSGIAIETKLNLGWSKIEILRQLERYAEHDEVNMVVLITDIAIALPPLANGKDLGLIKIRNGGI